MNITLHLVLRHHWFDLTASGEKLVEYRKITPRWTKLIWDRRDQLTHVRFARGYTRTTLGCKIVKIDIGPCPFPDWPGNYYRIQFNRTLARFLAGPL